MTLRVALIGGGIGGLAAALFLRRARVQATVYEQATQLRETGAGVVLPPDRVRAEAARFATACPTDPSKSNATPRPERAAPSPHTGLSPVQA